MALGVLFFDRPREVMSWVADINRPILEKIRPSMFALFSVLDEDSRRAVWRRVQQTNLNARTIPRSLRRPGRIMEGGLRTIPEGMHEHP